LPISDTMFKSKAPGVMDTLMADFGFSVLDAAAILGNIGHECAGFTLMQEVKPTVKGSRGGFGWCQWTGPRRVAFEAYCKRNDLDPVSDKANYGYLFTELHGSEAGAVGKTKAASGLEAKVEAFEQAFLRAGVKNYPSRLAWAQKALDAHSKASQKPQVTPKPVPGPTPTPEPSSVPTGLLAALLAIVKAILSVFRKK